jgi:hypothetical protein
LKLFSINWSASSLPPATPLCKYKPFYYITNNVNVCILAMPINVIHRINWLPKLDLSIMLGPNTTNSWIKLAHAGLFDVGRLGFIAKMNTHQRIISCIYHDYNWKFSHALYYHVSTCHAVYSVQTRLLLNRIENYRHSSYNIVDCGKFYHAVALWSQTKK